MQWFFKEGILLIIIKMLYFTEAEDDDDYTIPKFDLRLDYLYKDLFFRLLLN